MLSRYMDKEDIEIPTFPRIWTDSLPSRLHFASRILGEEEEDLSSDSFPFSFDCYYSLHMSLIFLYARRPRQAPTHNPQKTVDQRSEYTKLGMITHIEPAHNQEISVPTKKNFIEILYSITLLNQRLYRDARYFFILLVRIPTLLWQNVYMCASNGIDSDRHRKDRVLWKGRFYMHRSIYTLLYLCLSRSWIIFRFPKTTRAQCICRCLTIESNHCHGPSPNGFYA